jgi:hypothetical protein
VHRRSNANVQRQSDVADARPLVHDPSDQLAKAAKPADPKIPPFPVETCAAVARAFYFDAYAELFGRRDQISWQDIAPKVGLAMGNTHNTGSSLTNTYLIAFEAPNDRRPGEGRDRALPSSIPRKPIKYLVLVASSCRP